VNRTERHGDRAGERVEHGADHGDEPGQDDGLALAVPAEERGRSVDAVVEVAVVGAARQRLTASTADDIPDVGIEDRAGRGGVRPVRPDAGGRLVWRTARGLLNYSAQTAVVQAVVWMLYVVIVLTVFRWPRKQTAPVNESRPWFLPTRVRDLALCFPSAARSAL
jgi:hypothetical protein